MELYRLDSQLKATDVVDLFESLIWTERWADVGDFELDIASTPSTRSMFTTGTHFAMNKTYKVMTVKAVEDKTEDDGKRMLKVTGNSLEEILQDRLYAQLQSGTQIMTDFIVQNKTAANAMRDAFAFDCVGGQLSSANIIPNYVAGNLYPTDSIAEDPTLISRMQKATDVLSFLKDMSSIYDLGFRLYRNPDTAQVLFNVYAGSDRTINQSTLSPVVFSPDLDNLLKPTELATIDKYKNVCRAVGGSYTNASGDKFTYQVTAYAPGTPSTVSGFDRREMLLVVTDDLSSYADQSAELLNRAKVELAKVRPLTALDGEVSQYSNYVYGKDYYLGDKVTEQNSDGLAYTMRATEQIFAQDDQSGERSYPTLSVLSLAANAA